MPAGLVAILSITGLLLVVALALFWWVNRPLRSDRGSASETLPLFGSDRVIEPRPIDDGEWDDEDELVAAQPHAAPFEPQAPTPQDVAAVVSGESDSSAHRGLRFAPPPGAYPGPSPRPEPRGDSRPASRAESRGEAPAAGIQAAVAQEASPAAPPRTVDQPRTVDPRAAARTQARTEFTTSGAAATASTFEGQSVRFSIPTDGTLQFLPGRLEITAGQDLGREIRFVRLPDVDGTRVTFGRVEGPVYRHVQLHDPTVSRMHAAMRREAGAWQLTNLSTTNPVVHNDRALDEGETLPLADGDRIEMGEVVFRFRDR